MIDNIVKYVEEQKKARKESKIKECLHPNQLECSNDIIRAHMIQNNKILSSLSENGKVYMTRDKLNKPKIVSEWGKKEATTYTCFCGKHDTELFSSIENDNFNHSNEHIFLYTYRCFANAFHRKKEMLKEQNILKSKGIPVDLFQKGIKASVSDLEIEKYAFDYGIQQRDYLILDSIVFEFAYEVKFAATAVEIPNLDLHGNLLQDSNDLGLKNEFIYYTVFPENGKTFIIISWFKKNNELFKDYTRQILNLSEKERGYFLNEVITENSDNIVLNIDFYNSWSETEKHNFEIYSQGYVTLMDSLYSGETQIARREVNDPLFNLFKNFD